MPDFSPQPSLLPLSLHPRDIQARTAALLNLTPIHIDIATKIITRDASIYHESGSTTLLPFSASARALEAIKKMFPLSFEAFHWDLPLTFDRPSPLEWSEQRPEAKRERVRAARSFIAATAALEAGRPAWATAGYREDRAGRVRLMSCFVRVRGPAWDDSVPPLALPKLLMEGGNIIPRPGGEVCFQLDDMEGDILVVEDVEYEEIIYEVQRELLAERQAPFKLLWRSKKWGMMSVFNGEEFQQALRDMQMEMVAGDSDMVFGVELT